MHIISSEYQKGFHGSEFSLLRIKTFTQTQCLSLSWWKLSSWCSNLTQKCSKFNMKSREAMLLTWYCQARVLTNFTKNATKRFNNQSPWYFQFLLMNLKLNKIKRQTDKNSKKNWDLFWKDKNVIFTHKMKKLLTTWTNWSIHWNFHQMWQIISLLNSEKRS